MSSQKRNLLIALVAIVILAVGYFMATNIGKESEQLQTEGKTLISQPNFKVAELSIEVLDDNATYVKDGINWVVVGRENTDIVQRAIDQLIAYVKTLEYVSIVAENLDQAEQFGLVDGNMITLKGEDGTQIQVNVGDRTVDGTGYYLNVTGEEKVYIVDAEAGQSLKMSPDNMRDRLPEYVNYDNSKYISILKADGSLYSIKPNPNPAPAEGYGEYIISGYYANDMLLLTESLRDSIGAPLYNVYASTFIDEPEDLSVYGLDNPQMTIEAEDNDGNTCQILIGDKTETGDYYAQFSNKPYVCTVNGPNLLTIENAKIIDIIGKFYLPINTNEIANITLNFDGVKNEVKFDQLASKVAFNGEEIALSEIADLMKYISLLTIDGELDEEMSKVDTAKEISVTDVNGNEYVLEFMEYDANYYAVKYNGATEFIMGRKALDLVVSAVNNI